MKGLAARLAYLLIACGVVFVLGSWLLQRQEMDNARQEQRWHVLQNQANEGKAALKSRVQFREEVGRLELEADRWLSKAPAGIGISELLLHLDRVSATTGVTLQHVPPSGDDASAARITVRGSRRRVSAFFSGLRADLYPFVADALVLFAVEGTRDVVQADFTVSTPLERNDGEP